mmetsp:Transcript_20891/g.60817  ORF Transcript_20891/g.60817 Transcript_20891/m.60817 type:complete len:112 (-) Transcript_20891:186-521(-)
MDVPQRRDHSDGARLHDEAALESPDEEEEAEHPREDKADGRPGRTGGGGRVHADSGIGDEGLRLAAHHGAHALPLIWFPSRSTLFVGPKKSLSRYGGKNQNGVGVLVDHTI